MTGDDDRLIREQEFHDARFAKGEPRPASRFYAVNRAGDAFFESALDALPLGAKVLDYGCGETADGALHAAKRELRITAIDLSPVAIEQAQLKARGAGVSHRIDFRVMNGEQLEFPPDEFDFVVGLGVLHHLNLARSLAEIRRVLKSDGAAVFVEPMGYNPLINLYRRRTPNQRTTDEHPLLLADLELIEASFRNCAATYFHLFDLLALPLARTRYLAPTVRALGAFDQLCFRRVPYLRRHAWIVGLKVAQPT